MKNRERPPVPISKWPNLNAKKIQLGLTDGGCIWFHHDIRNDIPIFGVKNRARILEYIQEIQRGSSGIYSNICYRWIGCAARCARNQKMIVLSCQGVRFVGPKIPDWEAILGKIHVAVWIESSMALRRYVKQVRTVHLVLEGN